MATQLQNRIAALAASFVDSVLEAVKRSSLEDLVGTSGSQGARSARAGAARSAGNAHAHAAQVTAAGRLRRRSAEDVAKVLEVVVSLLGSRKNGLRAEQIRSELSLQAKELPRILKEGLARKKIRAAGQKRATTYFLR
ncbi:MAG TPA: hypothetical protein VHV30_13865 [Polyangiaceae bacterium]|jgi:hypothetical protein|nr:hypothetical protein [Polyangiaceae bacterium]